MIYKYRVKRNGTYYNAGEDVPENSLDALPFSDEEIEMETNAAIPHEPISAKRGRPKKA